jgi:hypothetical protein
MLPIWCGVQPASASLLAHAFLSPCDDTSGKPASRHRLRIHMLKLAADLKGRPNPLARNVMCCAGVASMILASSACTGIVKLMGLRFLFLCCV